MAQPAEVDAWEDAGVQEFQKLSIKQADPEQSSSAQGPQGNQGAKRPAANSAIPIDPAIIEALQKGRDADRKTIADIEAMVIKFIGDTSRDILEFPVTYGTYQKMLAHRVAQAYGLQTSTVDYEDGHGHVVGSRTKDTRLRKVKLIKMDLSSPEFQQRETVGGDRSGAPKILFRRPGGPDHGRPQSGNDVLKPSNSSQSMKEREEDYNRARERLGIGGSGGGEMPHVAHGLRLVNPPQPFPGSRGGYSGGRGPVMLGRDSGGGRGRKAVFRDRDRELQDPDYVRGFNRDGQSAPYDQAYELDGGTHHDFSPSQSWGSGQYRQPPPPPPPHPSSPYSASAKMQGQLSSSPASSGLAMGMYPSGTQGMPPAIPQVPGMSPAYPGGMPMSPYAMAGYPPHMTPYPGMPGQQAMYAAPGVGYSYGAAQMGPAAYGYMEAGAGQEVPGMGPGSPGSYHMLPAGYALYPQHHMAAMQGGHARPMAMQGMAPVHGLEHAMYYPGAGQYVYPMPPQGVPAGAEGKQQQGWSHGNHHGKPHSGNNVQHSDVGGGGPRHDSGSSNTH